MKKRMLLGLCLALCLLAAGCADKKSDGGAQDAEAAAPTADPAVAINDVPTLPPDEALTQVIDPAFYDYQQLAYGNGSLVLDYPAHWNRVPGTNTICYIEPVRDGDTPARFAFTQKVFAEAPSDSTKSSQLASFIKAVAAEYDSYEYSPMGTGVAFLGDSDAYYATYTAVKGDISVKGYVLMAKRDSALYAYHFRAPEDDFEAFTPVMEHIRGSIAIK